MKDEPKENILRAINKGMRHNDFKRIGLIYEAMEGNQNEPFASMHAKDQKYTPDESKWPTAVKTMKMGTEYAGTLNLRFDKNALMPFLKQENESATDFLKAVGVPIGDNNSQEGDFGGDESEVGNLTAFEVEKIIAAVDYLFGTQLQYDELENLIYHLDMGDEPEERSMGYKPKSFKDA